MAYQPKSYRKFLATGVATAMVATAVAPTVSADAHTQFTDVREDGWYAEAISYAVQNDYVQGYPDETFRPGNSMTRAEFAAVITRAADLDVPADSSNNFNDTVDGAWYEDAIAATVEAGIFEGYGDNTFRPNEEISRAEIATVIVNTYDLELQGDAADTEFNDLVEGAWYEDAIKILASNNAVNGYQDGSFRPGNDVTRAEAVTFIYNVETQVVDPAPVVGNVDVTVDGSDATVTAMVEQADSATITINPDEDLDVDALLEELDITAEELEAMLTQEVDVDEDNMVSATFTLPPGTHTATVEADGASNTSEPFTIVADADLSEDIAAAELAISELVALEDVTLRDRASIMAARALVDAILAVDEDAEIAGLEDLEALEAAIADLFEDAAIDDAYFVTTSSFNVEFDGGITGLNEEDFEVTVDIEGEDEFTLTSDEVAVTSNEEGTVYTFVHPDLNGTEGDVTVNFNDEDTVLEYDFTEETVEGIVEDIVAVSASIADAVVDEDGDVDVSAASDEEVEQLAALLNSPALNLENVEEGRTVQYAVEIDDSFISGVPSLQAAIDRVNAEFAETVEELIETLNTTVSQSEFSNALSGLGVAVNEDLLDLSDYFTAIQAAQPQTLQEVRDVVEAVEVAAAEEAFADALAAPTTESVENARDFLLAFLEDNEDRDALLEQLDDLGTLAAINDAIDGDDVDVDALETALGNADIDGFGPLVEDFAELFDDVDAFTSLEDVQAFIDNANADAVADILESLNEDLSDEDVTVADLDDEFDDLSDYLDSSEFALDEFVRLFQGTEFASLEELRAALEEATLTASFNDDVEDFTSLLLELDDEDFFNLGSNGRSDAAAIFAELNDGVSFDSEEQIREALAEAIAVYNERLTAVNEATTIVQTRDALRDAVPNFDRLSNQRQLEIAETFRDATLDEEADGFDEDAGRVLFNSLTGVDNFLNANVDGFDDEDPNTSVSDEIDAALLEDLNEEFTFTTTTTDTNQNFDFSGTALEGSTVSVEFEDEDLDTVTVDGISVDSDGNFSGTVDVTELEDIDEGNIEFSAISSSNDVDSTPVTGNFNFDVTPIVVGDVSEDNTSSDANTLVASFGEEVGNVDIVDASGVTAAGFDSVNTSVDNDTVTFDLVDSDGNDVDAEDNDSFDFTVEDTNGNEAAFTATFSGGTWTVTDTTTP
ncbi:S-layer homology domain-containing protein [Alkalicoccus urumqiensis]|uniref:SLH domain-containing protein n=1 Tax=Alkalicoccus urumqiensis TaxID=1548213 RepID=A0A2P6MHP8_ALKUR|nr:S-layer homology domain-containing protein [Alkalicoccus urumqiensis]PRO65801.1 hypothetical protein C6I21_07845 [Alkalicoccus urumqiensis]